MKKKVPKGMGMTLTHKTKVDNSAKIKGKPKAVGKPKFGNSGKMKKGK